MTKFEEEVKRPKKAYIDPFSKREVDFTGVAKKFTEGAQTLKEWKEYAFLLEDKLKLQQQALPVVPECVGKELYNIDFNYWIENKMTLACFTARTLNWLEQHREDWNIEYYICKLRFGGFTVEKPQLFYLKHIDMSKSDAHLNWYLAKGTDNVLIHQGIKKNKVPKLKCILKLTQQEIDSMQTGSYEQIKVENENE